MDKPEVWFSMVEAMFEDCNVTNSKQRYNKVLYRLPVAVVESLATLVAVSRTTRAWSIRN
jgi:hypothetical protein